MSFRDTSCLLAAPQQHLNFLPSAIQSEITPLLSREYVSYYTMQHAELFESLRSLFPSLSLFAAAKCSPGAPHPSHEQQQPFDIMRFIWLVCCQKHWLLQSSRNNGLISPKPARFFILLGACLRHVGMGAGGRAGGGGIFDSCAPQTHSQSINTAGLLFAHTQTQYNEDIPPSLSLV